MNEATAELIAVEGMAAHSDAIKPQSAPNGHGQDDGNGHSNHYSPSLTSFSPEQEAKFFVRLLLNGVINYRRACSEIEMKCWQRDWLIQNGFAKPHQIALFYDLRQRTLRLFETMAREYGFNGHGDHSDSIPIPLQSSRSIPPSSSRAPEGKHAPVLPLASVSIAP